MGKIVLMSSVSLDGFFEGPDRDISWHLVNEVLSRYLNGQFRATGAFIYGRVTYELMESVWPAADRNPDLPAALVEFGGIWRDMPKYLFSRTVTEAGWNTTVIPGVVPEQIAELKARTKGDIVLSGVNLASTFLRLGMVDDVQVFVNPVVLGRGRRLFEDPDVRMDLSLVETRTFSNGVVSLRYSNRRTYGAQVGAGGA
ncbi:dihydrofolate reductase family protein [Pseudarthrobacter sulfonivorans]|uniref:dihydrofolate reductase family protein n=1 Tax=Pseudarthrobacter sulfonivorans TaxID=121292 RepID=UPI00286694D4|nr:dihydrofolate reductase family protein [Pseudarthrobacter sulfonivorans]MDR6415681.1 dihydrofolate reductase [Pseudarthrobacter sulfonivorans]